MSNIKILTIFKSIVKKILNRTPLPKAIEVKSHKASEADAPEASPKKLDLQEQPIAADLSGMGKPDREYVRNKGTQEERRSYHQLARTLKQEIFEARQKLANEYITSNIERVIDRDLLIESAQGIATTSLADYPPFKAALTEAREIIAQRDGDELLSKGSLDFIASSKRDFDANSAIAKLALDPNLMIPITRYFGVREHPILVNLLSKLTRILGFQGIIESVMGKNGMLPGVLPILFGFDINRASKKEILKWSSHLYHLDPEDTTQIKVFIYLNDVDECTGPFTALPADRSAVAVKHLNYAIGRLEDEQVYQAIGYGHEKVCTGSTGTVVFCDTNRCLHYGGRIQERERYVLTIYYSLPTSTWFPLFPGDGERRNLTPLLRPTQDSLIEKAILGEELVLPRTSIQ